MTIYPLHKMVSTLMFESSEECVGFLRCHGVGAEEEEDTIYMERASFFFPENQPRTLRAQALIESKKTCSYGEIMNGGPLPRNPYLDYVPHNSFDENGFLKVESYEGKDQVRKLLIVFVD